MFINDFEKKAFFQNNNTKNQLLGSINDVAKAEGSIESVHGQTNFLRSNLKKMFL